MKTKKDLRPENYQYFDILVSHLGGDLEKIFTGELVYPRQLEIHLPGDHRNACNFRCSYCQGRLLNQPLDPFEKKGLKLVRELEGKIPFHIYGGAYTEPLLNPYFIDFLKLTKKTGSHFGIHTNGSLLRRLEETEGLISKLTDIAEDKEDYLSISLDAGTTKSHCKTKGLNYDWFSEIIEGIRIAVKKRKEKEGFPSVRVCYLLNDYNSSEKEIKGICDIMKEIKPDSLRFSIPYDLYGKDFKKVKKYKEKIEIPKNKVMWERLLPFLSNSQEEKPYIFYLPPKFQDVEKMNFKKCLYGYYQITLAADGHVYRCSSTASPTFPQTKIGRIPENTRDFEEMIIKAQSYDFNPSECFRRGARCNRMALEINTRWEKINEKK